MPTKRTMMRPGESIIPKRPPPPEPVDTLVEIPKYKILVPSIHDGTQLNCRVRYPERLGYIARNEFDGDRGFRGAIVAAPMAQLGGSQEDRVVQAAVEVLIHRGYIVMTFDYRDGSGKTTWFGRAELDDYISAFGFFVNYLDGLSLPEDPAALSRVESVGSPDFNEEKPFAPPPRQKHRDHILLSGYSYGSLVTARLPDPRKMIERFKNAEEGSVEMAIRELARSQAKTDQRFLDHQTSPRGYEMRSGLLRSPERQRQRSSSRVTVGGAVGTPSRPSSRDGRRSGEILRNIISHVPHPRRHSDDGQRSEVEAQTPTTVAQTQTTVATSNEDGPTIRVAYLLISPVTLFVDSLAPLSFFDFFSGGYWMNSRSGLMSLKCPVFMIYGENDPLGRIGDLNRLSQKLKRNNPNVWNERMSRANHQWEGSTLKDMANRLNEWLKNELVVAG